MNFLQEKRNNKDVATTKHYFQTMGKQYIKRLNT